MLSSLSKSSYAILDDFLTPTQSADLMSEALQKYEGGLFRPAGVGKGGERQQEIRGDEICWWDTERPQSSELVVAGKIASLIQELNRSFFLGIHDWEAHYARYPEGAFYQKHLDRFRDDDKRAVSFVLHLSSDWKESEGGELVLYPPGIAPVTLLPRPGRLVLFLSDAIPHEVRVSRRVRWSVAAWLRRRGNARGMAP